MCQHKVYCSIECFAFGSNILRAAQPYLDSLNWEATTESTAKEHKNREPERTHGTITYYKNAKRRAVYQTLTAVHSHIPAFVTKTNKVEWLTTSVSPV